MLICTPPLSDYSRARKNGQQWMWKTHMTRTEDLPERERDNKTRRSDCYYYSCCLNGSHSPTQSVSLLVRPSTFNVVCMKWEEKGTEEEEVYQQSSENRTFLGGLSFPGARSLMENQRARQHAENWRLPSSSDCGLAGWLARCLVGATMNDDPIAMWLSARGGERRQRTKRATTTTMRLRSTSSGGSGKLGKYEEEQSSVEQNPRRTRCFAVPRYIILFFESDPRRLIYRRWRTKVSIGGFYYIHRASNLFLPECPEWRFIVEWLCFSIWSKLSPRCAWCELDCISNWISCATG